MKDFAELTITGSADDLQRFIRDMTTRLVGWRRNFEREKDLADGGDGSKHIAIETPRQRAGLPAATLYLHPKEADGSSYGVVNIVPIDAHRLSFDEYNAILSAFYEENVKGRTEAFGLLVEHASGEFTPEDLVKSGRLSAENLRKLRLFSRAANKSTGSSHPLDEQRWWDFICSLVTVGEVVELDTLRKLLMEDQGWHEEGAIRLSHEYETLTRFLRFFLERFRNQEDGQQ